MASWARDPDRLSGQFEAFRQVAVGWPPFWHPGVTPQPLARWHREGEGLAQYCSLRTDGAWAELVRYRDIRTEDDRREHFAVLWQLWAEETDIADLARFDVIDACGLDAAMFVDDDHRPCQALADDLRDAGYRGLLSPSASLPNAVNLTLFGARRELYGRPETLTNRRPDLYVPVNMAADASSPPAHIMRTVRYYGEPHPGYDGWAAARSSGGR